MLCQHLRRMSPFNNHPHILVFLPRPCPIKGGPMKGEKSQETGDSISKSSSNSCSVMGRRRSKAYLGMDWMWIYCLYAKGQNSIEFLGWIVRVSLGGFRIPGLNYTIFGERSAEAVKFCGLQSEVVLPVLRLLFWFWAHESTGTHECSAIIYINMLIDTFGATCPKKTTSYTVYAIYSIISRPIKPVLQ